MVRLPRLPRVLLVAAAAMLPILLDRLFPPPLALLYRPPAVMVSDRAGEPLRIFLPADGRLRLPVRLSEVPDELVRAVVAAEDRRFFRHLGVDPLAVVRAAWSNLRARRVVSGASTIPMQIARLAEPAPRTPAAKLREAWWAVQLSLRLGKRELLEIYLNLAPYGGHLEGVGAAAFAYFGKPPAALSTGEIALLVALPRSPVRFDPTRDPAAARAARDRVLAVLAHRGVIAAERAAAARREGLPTARRRLPFAAPHASRWAAELAPGRPRVATTLDRRLQAVAEDRVRARIGELRARGIGNAAAVVVETRNRALRALVGSAGFFEDAHAGQVNGALARRSPGSALKPLLYALAFDRGLVVPESYLLDVPTDFSGYVAENYDGRYRGRVTAREALAASLNAPAVRLLSQVGLESFLALLRRGGLTTLERPAAAYGLPLILGGGEVTLVELANLYASLAEGGLHRPLRFLAADDEALPGFRLVSRPAARLVTEALTDLTRPDLPAAWELARDVPAVAWKTGTSYGHRDAWAVGISGRYAAGVWVGNFDGRPVRGISGADDAAPLLFDLFRSLGGLAPPAVLDPTAPRDLLTVCAASHELPGRYCPRRVEVDYLPGISRLPRCRLHRRVFVDRDTGELLAGDCLGRRPHAAAVVEVDPPELAAWRRAQGLPAASLPALSPACGGAPAAEAPRIVSPDPATPYRLRADAPLEHQRIPLLAQAGPLARRLYWYEDGLLVAAAPPGERLFVAPRRGRHRVVVVDDAGRSDSVGYLVE